MSYSYSQMIREIIANDEENERIAKSIWEDFLKADKKSFDKSNEPERKYLLENKPEIEKEKK